MASKVQSTVGSLFYVSAGLPATLDSAGYTALTYTLVGEVTDIGAIGKTFTLITHMPVSTGETVKFKGSSNAGQIALKLGKATLANTDVGQVILKTASDSYASFSFKITAQDATDQFFTGKVMSFVTNVGGPNNILTADVSIEIDSRDIIETI